MHNRILPKAGSVSRRKQQHADMMNSIHKATVTDVYLDNGTCQVIFEKLPLSLRVNFPLLGLSVPLGGDGYSDWKSSSWGRYIPHVGDVLLIAFEYNNSAFALGYYSVDYREMKLRDADSVKNGEGGISWGDASHKELKSGDWDFKSSNGSYLTLSDRARIGSNNCSVTMDSNNASVSISTNTLVLEPGNVRVLSGTVKRKLLPIDFEESIVPSGRGDTNSQEHTVSVNWPNSPATESPLAFHSIGDVTEEKAGVNMLKVSSLGNPVRKHEYFTDRSGTIKVHEETIDSFGNYLMESNLAIKREYKSPLSDWSVLNKSFDITSSQGFDLTSPDIKLTGNVTLGGPAALPLLKVPPDFSAQWSIYFTGASAALMALNAIAPNPAFTAASTAATMLVSALSSNSTTLVKGL